MSLQSAIKAKVDALQQVPNAWANGVMRLQPSLLARLQRLTGQLTTDADGNLLLDVANLARVDEIITELSRFLTRSEYAEMVTGLAEEFALQQGRTIAYFEAATGAVPSVSTFASTRYAQASEAAIRNIAANVPDQFLMTPIRNALLEGISTGSGYTSLLENLQSIMIGTDTTEGNLLRYSRQIVSDSLAVTDREFTNIVANDLGLEWYLYAGGEIDTTRCFCDARNGLYWHREEVKAWGRGEQLGACATGTGWAGMFKGTNESTIFVYCGGYNCQHSLLPVSEFIVPAADMERAKSKGYVKSNNNRSQPKVNISAVNNSGYETDVSALSNRATDYAKSIGYSGDVQIVINKGRTAQGGVSFSKPVGDKQFLNPKIQIDNNGSLTTKQLDDIVRHEMTHLKQGQSDRFFLQKIEGSWNIIWEGKPYMKMSEYNRIVNGFSGKASAAYRTRMYEKYRSLPWEAEAHLAGDPFR